MKSFNKSVLAISLSIICTSSIAQEESVLGSQKDKYVNYSKVMLVPFNEDFYFSDSDKELADYNKKSSDEISKWFKEGLNFNVNARILSMYNTLPMTDEADPDMAADLKAIYGGISYKLDKPYHYEVQGKYTHQESDKSRETKVEQWINDKLHINDHENSNILASGGVGTGKYIEENESKEYMSATIKNPEMLQFMNEKYGTDLFVFINQFELKKDYEVCLDRANNKYTRKVKVHFSIYNSDADLLYGDVVTVIMPSNSNDMDHIIRNNFPLVADYMASYIPKQKQLD